MKTLLVSIWLAAIGIAAGADFDVRIQSHGTNVTQRPASDFATNVLKLFRSCSIDSTAYAATNAWETLLARDSFIHVRLSIPVTFRETGETKMNEVFVPLPSGKFPAHLFARSGTNVFALTKFDPVALGRVAREPALGISAVEPYGSLARLAASRER
jgi:hypothetical protein